MRSSAIRVPREEDQPVLSDQQTTAFANELSDLCRKHGIGIAGEPTLFRLEQDDLLHEYKVDDQSRLRQA